MKKIALLLISFVVTPALTFNVNAETVFDKETVSVIQERIYDRKHEIGFTMGYIPDDDFYEEYPLGIGYTYNFSKHVAWEVARVQYFLADSKPLKTQLQEYDLAAVSFDKPIYMVHSSFILKPTYGKDAVWDSNIINHETFYSLGGGIANYEREYSFGPSTTETVFSVTAGLGRRYFLSKQFALVTEVKSYTQFKEDTTETNVYLGLGLSYRFNFSDRNNTVRKKTDSVYRYLNDDDE